LIVGRKKSKVKEKRLKIYQSFWSIIIGINRTIDSKIRRKVISLFIRKAKNKLNRRDLAK